MKKSNKKKITLFVPDDLLHTAQEVSGVGISGTVVRGLELLAASAAYAKLRKLRGKLPISLNLKELRADR